MKKYLFLFIFLSQLSFSDSYKYIGTGVKGERFYISTNPEYLNIYSNGYKFWYKSINAQNQTVETTRITLITNNKRYCVSDLINSNGITTTRDCDSVRWISYSPDSMLATFQDYLDSVYGKRPNKSKD